MSLYECDFKKLEERICKSDDESIDAEFTPNSLGSFICRLLSVDYEHFSNTISSFLEDSFIKGRKFPADELQVMLSNTFQETCFCDFNILQDIMERIYCTPNRKSFEREYGSFKNAFFVETYRRFKVEITLQAYLEESENALEMVSAINFERFVNGFLEMKIARNEQAISLSEYVFSSDVFPGCDINAIVKDAFSNLEQFNDHFSVFAMNSLHSFLISSIYYFFLNGFRFKRCANCSKFFVPLSRSDEIYCNNISPQDQTRTCKEYGSQKLWYDRLKNDEVAKLARNVYSAKQMLVRRNPDIVGYREMFEYFKSERKKWDTWVKSGKKSREEYINWLNEMKAKKTL